MQALSRGGRPVEEQAQPRGHVAPRASRPRMPEGYGVPAGDEGLLPWSFARERLESAPNYWIGSTGPDGRPHAMPVWGAWVEGALYFGTSPQTRTGRNL